MTKVCMVEHPKLPLSGFADQTYFKLYLSDIGLLRVRSGIYAETILSEDGAYAKYKGAFAENYVLNELLFLGKTPYFWRSGNTAEVDFLYEDEDGFVPVEVKSADNTQAKSYRQFCQRFSPKRGYKLSLKNIAENLCGETKTLSLPLYLLWNLEAYR